MCGSGVSIHAITIMSVFGLEGSVHGWPGMEETPAGERG